MYELKPIRVEAIPAALEKAERYRLLNQPRPAESICRDVLRADPENQQALVILLLSLTDQFGRGYNVDIRTAREVLSRISDDYKKTYYDGVVCERWGKGLMAVGSHREAVNDWLREAMKRFEKAEKMSPPGNDEAVLRWNACARLLNKDEPREPGRGEPGDSIFVDEIPPG